MTKAITLHQPWATLIALGVKTIETRSWKPPAALLGERLLIHAGAKAVAVRHSHQIGEWRTYGADGALTTSPRPARMYQRSTGWAKRPEDAVTLPFGAIVASCILADAVPMEGYRGTRADKALVIDMPHEGEMRHQQGGMWLLGPRPGWPKRVEDQRPYGDFVPGRWAWLLEDVKPTTERCPACWHTPFDMEPCPYGLHQFGCGGNWSDCATCGGSGRSEPVPAKGHQRVWEWTP